MMVPVATGRPVSGWKILGAALAALALAASWMVISLVAGRAGLGKAMTEQSVGQATLGQAVTRTGVTNFGTKVQALFATPEYYQRVGDAAAAAEVDPAKYLVFIVTEENHDALKPAPIPTLSADGRKVAAPVKERLLSSSDHHRTRLIRFARTDSEGTAYLPKGARKVELLWPDLQMAHRADHALDNPLSWAWPMVLPTESIRAALTPASFLILTAGLFAALSPCLIQLTLYYLSSLAGTTAGATVAGGVGVGAGSRRRVITTALMFVAGISAAYTLGGLLAGYMGRVIQVSDVLGTYGRWIALGSGAIIVLMGLWAVLQSEAPAVCKMPVPGLARVARSKTGPVAPFLMGFLMSLGCLQCFGGAIFASLLLYVGSLSSPGLGALMLFIFSLGIAVPFLAAAFAWERISGWLSGLGRSMQHIGLVSGVMMMTFGVLMMVDRFHWISGVLLRWMPFLQA